jgi:putative transposase
MRFPVRASQIRAVLSSDAVTIRLPSPLPSTDTAAMLFWSLLASGQISMRKIDGWQTLAIKSVEQPIDLAA